MDCRTARALITSDRPLSPDERRIYEQHLAQCAACRDDASDPLGRTLRRTTVELALPPPDFTARLLQRLPRESPLQLQQTVERRRWLWWLAPIAGMLAIAALGVLGWSVQSLWRDTTLDAVVTTVQRVIQASAVPLLISLVSVAIVAGLLRTSLRSPGPLRVLGSAALACALVVAGITAIDISDRANLARAGSGGDVATIVRSIDLSGQPAARHGSVVSLLGDVRVAGTIDGTVSSLAGSVALEPGTRVGGDVLAGTGQLAAVSASVAGSLYRGPQNTALGSALISARNGALSPTTVRVLAALLGALITLALAALLVLLWPQMTLRISQVLPASPWLALGVGVLLTALLGLLALPLLALLALTVLGLLLVPLLLLLIHLVYVQGLAAVGQALGRLLTGRVTTISALWGVAAQLVAVIGLGLVMPAAGLAIFYMLGSLGLGAMIIDRRAGSTIAVF